MKKTILLVDDDPTARELAIAVLRKNQYQVLTASDGLEAIRIYIDHHQEIDLIVTDVSLPLCSGPEFVSTIRHLKLDQPVLYVSANTSLYPESPFSQFSEEREMPILEKPFAPKQLSDEIGEILKTAGLPPNLSVPAGPAPAVQLSQHA